MGWQQLEQKLAGKRMVVCVGAGGVGKTTFAAALAVSAAQNGKNVACLTIDPAKRLGDVLGIGDALHFASDTPAAQEVDPLHDLTPLIAEAGGSGSLHVGMLDAKNTFDAVVLAKSSSPAHAEKILENRLYRYVSGSLSGMQEYMALERLCQLREDASFDLIVLDTPPSDNVVDFFSAPSRVRAALDGPLVRMMRRVYGERNHSSVDLLGKWALGVFTILSKITGSSLMDEIMEFVDALSDLFGNFSVRAQHIEQMLASSDVEVLMITRPDSASAQEASALQKILEGQGFHVDGLIFNQCTYPSVETELPEALCEPCRSEMAQLNRDWNIVYQEEQQVMSDVMRRSPGFQCVCLIPLITMEKNRIESLRELWRQLQPADTANRG